MFVIVDGQTRPLPQPQTLATLLLSFSPSVPFAVAVNGEFVPLCAYEDCRIDSGDEIDIVHPTAGG